MILGHGIDATDIERIRRLLTTMEEDFLLGTFTQAERSIECGEHERAPYYAGRLAAKEAVAKALGTGFAGNISWQQIEVYRRGDGRPDVRLRGAALAEARHLGIVRWLVSISHTETVAVASAIAVGQAGTAIPG